MAMPPRRATCRTIQHGWAGLIGTIGLLAAARGQTWQAAQPSPRDTYAVLLHDPVAQRLLLVGRADGQAIDREDFVWSFDGQSWQALPSQHVPPDRPFRCVYDTANQRLLLLTWGYQPAAETWTWDGTDWQQLVTTNTLPGRSNPAMVYDPVRQRVQVVGGFGQFGPATDLWELAGATWSHRQVANQPPGRWNHGAGYDPVRQRLVVVNGNSNTVPMLRDTWECDGTTWVQVPTPTQLVGWSPLSWHQGRQRLVMPLGNTVWELDGQGWRATASPLPPAAFGRPVYEPAADRLLLYGDSMHAWDGGQWSAVRIMPPGVRGSAANDPWSGQAFWHGLGQTFRHDGTDWHSTPATAPASLSAALVSAGAQGLLMVAASSAPTTNLQTMRWQTGSWQAVPTATTPPYRRDFSLAFDSWRRRVVLFGGNDGQLWSRQDTWEFDGVAWLQRSMPWSPPARRLAAMAFDAARGATVLFGGEDASASPLPDTWLLDATGWRQILTPNAPLGLAEAAMAFDPWRGAVVLDGGREGQGYLQPAAARTWTFDGGDWVQLPASGRPPRRFGHGLVQHPGQDALLAVGGFAHYEAVPTPAPRNSWTLTRAATATLAELGNGCAGTTGVPHLTASSASLGTTATWQCSPLAPGSAGAWLAFGFAVDRWLGQPLPYDLGTAGLPGCALWIAPEPGLGLLAPPGPGGAVATVPWPALPALAGVRLAVQALVFDAQAVGGAVVSQAMLVTLH